MHIFNTPPCLESDNKHSSPHKWGATLEYYVSYNEYLKQANSSSRMEWLLLTFISQWRIKKYFLNKYFSGWSIFVLVILLSWYVSWSVKKGFRHCPHSLFFFPLKLILILVWACLPGPSVGVFLSQFVIFCLFDNSNKRKKNGISEYFSLPLSRLTKKTFFSERTEVVIGTSSTRTIFRQNFWLFIWFRTFIGDTQIKYPKLSKNTKCKTSRKYLWQIPFLMHSM